ncbi:Rossmann-like and DUF2520 domain-containing protein [Ferruginibacter sp. SUN106]|uniref:Rossmann-like and DUF2520 domain-containing protein n=1 Tax=Ferruginibacter sp. SUN106 TaxID=2978348 RepID=UPI003D35E40C
MRIVIIGSGNVATVLGRLCKKNNHQVIQVMSRHKEHAKILADELGSSYTNYDGITDMTADIYIVAITDGVLFDLNKSFKLGNKLIVHTAGSVSKDVLQEISHNYGILYPFQSLRKEMISIPEIPLLVDGNTEEAATLIEDFAKTLSPIVKRTTDEERLKLHVAGVVVNNFTNHLYALAENFCDKEKLDFKLLLPLIQSTAQRISDISPKNLQTGPAIRNDVFTLDKHLRILATHPKLKYLYLKLTDSIMNP